MVTSATKDVFSATPKCEPLTTSSTAATMGRMAVGMEEGSVSITRAVHRYRLYEILPKEAGRPGPQRRRTILQYDELGEEELATVRRLNERKLGPGCIVEIDGVVVRRGTDLSPEDVDASEPLVAPQAGSSPYEVNEYAHRLLWDMYERDAAASVRLRDQCFEMNQRALEQGKAIDAMLTEMQAQRLELLKQVAASDGMPSAFKNMSIEDLRSLIEVGVGAVKASQGQAPGRSGSGR